MTADAPPPFSESAGAPAPGADDLPAYDSPPNDVKLAVVSAEKGGDVLITLTPPHEPLADKKAARAPADICCVIDVSGSMDDAATMPDEAGNQTETELSVLDVVRHAMRTIMATLGPQDRMAVVGFSDKAIVYADLTFMDDAGKAAMETTIDALKPLGSTNLWDGLKTGMDLVHGIYKGPEAQSTSRPKAQPAHARTPSKSSPTSPISSGTISRLKGVFSGKGKGKAAPPAEPEVQPPAPKEPEPEKVTPPAPKPAVDATRVASIFLLTDGMPNVHPPSGELQAFKNYLDARPATFTVSTFGFGYSLDSQLLLKLAAAGGGQYSFIPDSGMVGTVFVHAVANALATYAPTAMLAIEVAGDVDVLGDLKHVVASWGVQVELGDVMYGQTRDVVVRVADPENVGKIAVTATFTPWTDSAPVEVRAAVMPAQDAAARAEIKYHARRLELVSALLQASKSEPDAKKIQEFKALAQSIRTDPDLAGHKNALALVEDIEGQVLLAVENPEYWERWGCHYLGSLARAHQRQHCVNFKDAGQLVYGADSPVFLTARETLDAAFQDIPAPKPTRQTYGGHAGMQVSSMSGWYSSSGPCVDGACTVVRADGTCARVDALRRGDAVRTVAGPRAVVAVVRTPMPDCVAQLCVLPGGLRVTPWHPIRLAVSQEWVFPADVAEDRTLQCDAVYSILLERADGDADAHAMRVCDVDVIALGHGVHSGILDHAFFASYANVVHSIASLSPAGHPEDGVFECAGVVRGVDGRVAGFAPAEEVKTMALSSSQVEVTV